MTTQSLRNYIDIINEHSQAPAQLDEGILQDIKTKAGSVLSQFKSIPGIGKAYQKAKTFAPQLKQIFASAKSGEDVINGIKQLASSKAVAEDVKPLTAVGAVGSTAFITWEVVSGFLET